MEAIVETERPAAGLKDRAINLGWSLFLFSPIALARALTPDAHGYGTHQQLGLPPCTFLYLTGLPCPFCGMTTTWTWAAHLRFERALVNQPMGLLLFFVALGLSGWLFSRSLTGKPAVKPTETIGSMPLPLWWTALVLLLVSWVWKALLIRGIIAI